MYAQVDKKYVEKIGFNIKRDLDADLFLHNFVSGPTGGPIGDPRDIQDKSKGARIWKNDSRTIMF